ncbi:ATP-dependent zinc metalloprotease FtsH 3 [Phycisphaerales bacterium]|nr:ATP-dependent zinc metalloprotease FtsH 3 [Phycisphaerales bacterium]
MKPDRLRKFLNPRHPCVRIPTHEEFEASELVYQAASWLGFTNWTWSATQGLRPSDLAGPAIPETENPGAALVYLSENLRGSVLLVTHDLAEHLADPLVLRAWRDLVERARVGGENRLQVVMIDHSERVPDVVAALSTVYRIELPDDPEIERICRRVIARLNRDGPVEAAVTPDLFRRIVQQLRGLSRRQVESVITEAVLNDRALTEDDLAVIIEAKRRAFESVGVLEFVKAPTSLADIGGLERLKRWLGQRTEAFSDAAAACGITPPRGVMLLGVQGAGKSLAAKAIATAWTRPLMRLDPSALYDRYIGESERRLRDALRQAEAMAPMVLWIDEIEKGFAGAASTSTDGGLSRRMFGTLLTWMQEHHAPVFLVATANDIEALPPELLRKGRFDEIFFVDLPGPEARRRVFEIHLAKRSQPPAHFDLDELSKASEGFSGAEIEQAVIAALYDSFDRNTVLTTRHVVEAIRGTSPLSVTMRERVDELRAWAAGRCVPAD